jgi:O-antigen ligase
MTGVAPRWLKYSSFLLFPFGVSSILATGSRANLLGFFMILPFLPLFSGRKKFSKEILYCSSAFGVLLVAFMLSTLVGNIRVTRWFEFAEHIQTGDLAGNRSQAWVFCLTKAWDSLILFGHGPGSYAVDFLRKDSPIWPHNIVLEALYEAGILGATAVILFFAACLHTMLRGVKASRTNEDHLLVGTLSAVVLSMTVMTLSHWDLDGARFLYIFAGLLHVNVEHVVRGARDFRRDGEDAIHSTKEGSPEKSLQQNINLQR